MRLERGEILMELKQYKTEIYNNTEHVINPVLDFFGEHRAKVAPKNWGYVISVWWMTMAGFERVTYEADGSTKLKRRLGFKHKFAKEQYTIKITNLHDGIENYKIGSLFSLSFSCPKGVPIICPIDCRDPLADFSEITIYPDRMIPVPYYGMTQPGGNVPYVKEEGNQGFRREVNLVYVKKSKPKLQKLAEVRHQLKQDDPEAYKYYDRHRVWQRDNWKVTNEMLQTPEDKQKKIEQVKKKLEDEQSYEDFR